MEMETRSSSSPTSATSPSGRSARSGSWTDAYKARGRLRREPLLTAGELCSREIWANKTRFAITTFGIFLGVASLVSNIAFMRGIDADMQRHLTVIGGMNLLNVSVRAPTNADEARSFAHSPRLTVRDA